MWLNKVLLNFRSVLDTIMFFFLGWLSWIYGTWSGGCLQNSCYNIWQKMWFVEPWSNSVCKLFLILFPPMLNPLVSWVLFFNDQGKCFIFYAVILCCRGTHPFMANVVQTVDGRKVKTANRVRLAFHMH